MIARLRLPVWIFAAALALAHGAAAEDEVIPSTKSASAATGQAAREANRARAAEDPVETPSVIRSEASAEETTDETAAPHTFDRYDALLVGLTIFVLAVFVGFEVIAKVPTTLHTPLMSGSNAISGITVVGAMIVAGYSLTAFSSFLGFLAAALAMINVVGGFAVTHRMLAMFKRK